MEIPQEEDPGHAPGLHRPLPATHGHKGQKDFYQWYNWTHHFPAGFIRDTYKKIFVNNDLIRGKMKIGRKTVSIRDYPGNVPIWSLGGSKDDIVPPKQANGHLDEIDGVAEKNKLSLVSEAGHMGLFRSSKVLKNDYSKVVKFLLTHSDSTEKPKKKTAPAKKKSSVAPKK